MVMSCALWGHRWRGESVLARRDNALVVAIINSGRSKDYLVMHLMRCLFFFMAWHDYTLVATHVEGKLNIAADALSWNHLSVFPSTGSNSTHSTPTGTARAARNQLSWLDLTHAEKAIDIFFLKGLASPTQQTNKSRKEQYLKFCQSTNLQPVPASESALCSFVSHLALESIQHRSIKFICR